MKKRLIQGILCVFILGVIVLGYASFSYYKKPEKFVSAKESTLKSSDTKKKTEKDIQNESIYSIKVGTTYITQYALESDYDLNKILGKTLEKNITERTFEDGRPGLLKELKFDGIELQLIALQKTKIFSILSIRVTSDKFTTSKGIRVGDTLERLTKIYPTVKTIDSDLNNCIYYLSDEKMGGTYDFLKFDVSSGIITEIRIENDNP